MTPADAARAAGDGGETDGAETARTAKSAEAFRTISEAAEELDIPAHVLRFWETKFPHLNPLKRGGRRRYYRPADMALLRGIRRLLYDEGLTIKGLQKVFRERGPRFVAAAGEGAEPSAALAPEVEAEAAGPDAGPRTRPSRDRGARLHALADSLAALRDRLRA